MKCYVMRMMTIKYIVSMMGKLMTDYEHEYEHVASVTLHTMSYRADGYEGM